MSRSKKVFINVGMLVLQQLTSIICGFIVPILIIKHYGSNVNGTIASITQFLAYITLLESGFGPVVKSLLYKPLAKNNKKNLIDIMNTSQKFFRNISKVFLIYIALLCIIYPIFINKEFDFIYTSSLVLILSINIFMEYYFGLTYTLYLQADQKNYLLSFLNVAVTIANTVLLVILINYNLSIHTVKLLSIILLSLKPIIIYFYVRNKCNINLKESKKDVKIKQKWYGLSQHIAYTIHSNTDIIVLTLFANVNEVSVYAVYLLVLTALKNITISLKNGVESAFGDMIARKESSNFKSKFEMYEYVYQSIVSIMYFSALFLIIPFVSIYTNNISDANYIRPLFACVITLAEFAWAFRLSYASLTHAAGHFKQTSKGAWIEALLNICISIILVIKFGLVGVAIGTLVSILYRMIDYVLYVSKNIIKRNPLFVFKKILLVISELIVLCFIVPRFNVNTYFDWFILAVIDFTVICVFIVVVNSLVYRKDFKSVLGKIKGIIRKF